MTQTAVNSWTFRGLATMGACAASLLTAGALAQGDATTPGGYRIGRDGGVTYGEHAFASWADFLRSDFAREHGLPARCGTIRPDGPGAPIPVGGDPGGGSAGDCSYNFTNPAAVYDPSTVKYRINVVVHVIQSITGLGYISPEMVQSQIDVLNEDFLALAGTPGGPGTDMQIEFRLATVDPEGNPTTGITYTTNDVFFLDAGPYYEFLAWDPHRYLNIYTNVPMGAGGLILGYVAFFPQDGPVGSNEDRVVVLWESFGRNSPNAPYDQGRTTTHEVGHYLGLFHTFQGGCTAAAPPGCYSSGDRICDTPPDAEGRGGCPVGAVSCGGFPIPVRNYMQYTNDACMNRFTFEQARRARCTLRHWRPLLYEVVMKPETCTGDLNESGAVDVQDLLILLSAWGPCADPGDCPADLNESGAVDVQDLLILLSAWGPCP